jgi:hypothetical protein
VRLGVEAENKVDEHGDEEHDGKHGGAQPVIIRTGATVADGRRSPVICQQSVDHDCHGWWYA